MKLHFLHLKNCPIFEQLQIEEALLRASEENFCLLNEGSPPSIVMGISGKTQELVNPQAFEEQIPVIRRFSGGGTVVVDHNTLFVSFIINHRHFDFDPFPEKIFRWSEGFYSKWFDTPSFSLKENDYVFDQKKFGGNAQYIRRGRWIHHTTLLWDFRENLMNLLLHPKKAPSYRQNRHHFDFLCRLKEFYPSKEFLITKFKSVLNSEFEVQETEKKDVEKIMKTSHRKSVTYVTQE